MQDKLGKKKAREFLLQFDTKPTVFHLCYIRKYVEKEEMGRACSTIGDRMGADRVLVGKPEGKGPLGRHRRRWEDYIKIHIQEVGLWGTDWVDLAENRESLRALVNAVMNLRVP
jgi:hypothetical protein